MRVVLDSNILARAASGLPGLAADLLTRCLDPVNTLYICSFQLTELSRVLRYERVRKLHGMDDAAIDAFLFDLKTACVMVTPADPPLQIARDPDDDEIIAAAIGAGAEFLCSLDRHLRAPSVVAYCAAHGCRIVTDLELLAELRSASKDDDNP